MFCPRCGKELIENSVFCQYCGHKFENKGEDMKAIGGVKYFYNILFKINIGISS